MIDHGPDAGRHDPVTSAAVPVFVSAGSNIDPVRNLRMAVRELERRFAPLLLSSVYRNKAEGFTGDDFLNMIIGFTTRERPEGILAELERLHAQAGRVRGQNPFGPRALDLDLILYGDAIDEKLRLPREDINRYSFVLGPLAEVAPTTRHPVTGETLGELWARFDQARHPLEWLPLSVLDADPRGRSG